MNATTTKPAYAHCKLCGKATRILAEKLEGLPIMHAACAEVLDEVLDVA